MVEINQKPITGLTAKTTSASYPATKPLTKVGCHVIVNVTAGCNSTDKLKIQIVGLDYFGNEYLLLDSTDMTANQPYVFKLAPFAVQNVVGGQANGLSDFLPDNILIKTVHSTAASLTYSIAINFL